MKPDTLLFQPSDWVPNNQRLPVLLYRSLPLAGDKADGFEALFRRNGWGGVWRNGIFSYQHYHIHAHEVLGVAAGVARVLIGGPAGRALNLAPGDCLVLPAGTGHQRLSASDDFLVVGAYPPGQKADICTEDPGVKGLRMIAAVPLPATDPVSGAEGGLTSLWQVEHSA